MQKITVDQVIAILETALEVEGLKLSDSSETIESWDSLAQLSIQSQLGKISDGRTDELMKLSVSYSVGEVLQVLRQAGLVD